MPIIKAIGNFFVSLRTAIWLSSGLLILFFFGAVIMPMREEFQALHTTPLFTWLSVSSAAVTWWLYGSILLISLLAVNTLVCSVESLLRKRSARSWLLTISPQVIHIGFLFILLAHLFSSYDSLQGMTMVSEGTALPLPDGITAVFDRINADVDASGYISDWSAEVRYFRDETFLSRGSLRPNAPSFYGGYGLYIKTVRYEQFPMALIQISRDPGAPWALVGGVLFLAGTVTLLLLKIRHEAPQE